MSSFSARSFDLQLEIAQLSAACVEVSAVRLSTECYSLVPVAGTVLLQPCAGSSKAQQRSVYHWAVAGTATVALQLSAAVPVWLTPWNSLLSLQLSNSHELHTLLAVVLKIGNFLNSNRQPLPSVGFRHAIV